MSSGWAPGGYGPGTGWRPPTAQDFLPPTGRGPFVPGSPLHPQLPNQRDEEERRKQEWLGMGLTMLPHGIPRWQATAPHTQTVPTRVDFSPARLQPGTPSRWSPRLWVTGIGAAIAGLFSALFRRKSA
jgi:hypothetical protein